MQSLNFVDYSTKLEGAKYAELETLLIDEQTHRKRLEEKLKEETKKRHQSETRIDKMLGQLTHEINKERNQREQSDLIFGRKISSLTGRVNFMEQRIQRLEIMLTRNEVRKNEFD
jgi:uncharacterized protein with von Willebrand factor type A (vWA) domain